MTFDILTLFPGMFTSPFAESILGKALDKGLIGLRAHNLRRWAEGRHQVTDDAPYGGGDGMIMKVEPVARALRDLRNAAPDSPVVLLTPQGKPFRQADAATLATKPGLIFVCGRYEGYDERIRTFVDVEYSLGDFVLTGGELAAMVMIDAIARLVPGVLGCEGSAAGDSFSDGLLEYPQYTRPAEFEGMRVPEVLLSGNHGEIARWRRLRQLERTVRRRPDLLEDAPLSAEERRLVNDMLLNPADETSG
ncbi:tRNA (guanosine(37)-N1)-methyltransferase TrmD [Geoalkalibacter sp.]|uniref:tRNA (guanosine(37)-N1)-methyltransferase TrmD n=1 Tax=Geoalkalibacter sp. TaxID=3041440 RepID=UPI00272EA700|nr:tRNA (guanosine(37)-N1)-methyltransferase TrmD [Geoalkalibacter sp.]